MLYFNLRRTVTTLPKPFDEIKEISIGGIGVIYLLTPENFPTQIPERKVIKGLSLGSTKSGILRIVPEDDNLYLFLDCKIDCSRGKIVAVRGLAQASYHVIANGCGERGGAVGWVTGIFKGKDGDVFLVEEPNGGKNMVYFVYRNRVYHRELQYAKAMFKALRKEIPFTLIDGKIISEEWRSLI